MGEMKLSAHGERFVPADFYIGASMNEKNGSENSMVQNLDYHIIDVTDDGEVMVVVNHDQVLSSLYVSTKISPYKVEFVVSLERVMFYNPTVTWTNSWLADTAGDKPFADVYKIQGLRGIYIA